MQVAEHLQRDGADRPLRHVDEDGVARLVERERQDPRRAVGEDEREGHGDEADVVEGERIDRPRVEQRDVYRRHPGCEQHRHREHHPQP